MDDRAEFQRFGQYLMLLVRDLSIKECDALTSRGAKMGSPGAERWRDMLAHDQRAQEAVRELIPDIVDQVLFWLLRALDKGELPLAWKREDGSYVDLYDLGKSEMAGWLLGTDPDGWRVRYSSQRWT